MRGWMPPPRWLASPPPRLPRLVGPGPPPRRGPAGVSRRPFPAPARPATAPPPARARPAAAGRPLLRADHGRPGRRAVRLAAPRHRGRLGGPGGHAVSPYLRSRRKRALDLLACLVLGALSAPVVGVAIVLVRLESAGH